MAQHREQDKFAKRTSRTIERFAGYHGGYGRTDQPDIFADIRDLDCISLEAKVRPGMKKLYTSGHTATVNSLLVISIGTENALGRVVNGTLDIIDVADII
jgi:hypothetical protein